MDDTDADIGRTNSDFHQCLIRLFGLFVQCPNSDAEGVIVSAGVLEVGGEGDGQLLTRSEPCRFVKCPFAQQSRRSIFVVALHKFRFDEVRFSVVVDDIDSQTLVIISANFCRVFGLRKGNGLGDENPSFLTLSLAARSDAADIEQVGAVAPQVGNDDAVESSRLASEPLPFGVNGSLNVNLAA